MGRIGKRILEIPKGVEVKVADQQVQVKGPKGLLTIKYDKAIKITVENGKVQTLSSSKNPRVLALQGLYNSLIKNMLDGVTKGFEKVLDIVGVGYRASKQGKDLNLQMGFSHPMLITPPTGIDIEVEGTTKIIVKGMDRQAVGAMAAKIRGVRPVEPYKGKGIRYFGEKVRKKAGKAAKAGAGA